MGRTATCAFWFCPNFLASLRMSLWATRRPEAYALHPLALRDDQIYPAAHFLIDKAEHY